MFNVIVSLEDFNSREWHKNDFLVCQQAYMHVQNL